MQSRNKKKRKLEKRNKKNKESSFKFEITRICNCSISVINKNNWNTNEAGNVPNNY